MKIAWDLFVVTLLIYTALFVPFRVCFADGSTDGQFIFDCLVDVGFLIDIIMTFFTATQESAKDEIVTNKS